MKSRGAKFSIHFLRNQIRAEKSGLRNYRDSPLGQLIVDWKLLAGPQELEGLDLPLGALPRAQPLLFSPHFLLLLLFLHTGIVYTWGLTVLARPFRGSSLLENYMISAFHRLDLRRQLIVLVCVVCSSSGHIMLLLHHMLYFSWMSTKKEREDTLSNMAQIGLSSIYGVVGSK